MSCCYFVSGDVPPRDRPEMEDQLLTVSTVLFAIMSSIASAGIVMAVAFFFFNMKYRNQRYVRTRYGDTWVRKFKMITLATLVFIIPSKMLIFLSLNLKQCVQCFLKTPTTLCLRHIM